MKRREAGCFRVRTFRGLWIFATAWVCAASAALFAALLHPCGEAANAPVFPIVLAVTLLVLSGAALLLWAGMAFRAARRSLEALADYARAMGEGRFETPPPRCREREFDGVAEAMGDAAKRLAEEQERQARFFQDVLHELRTPLTVVRCHSEGLICGVMNPVDAGRAILKETGRLSELAGDLLYISRAQRVREAEEALDIREVFSDAVAEQRPTAERQGIALVCRFDGAPVEMQCRTEDMRRICANLLSNALRYARTEVVLDCAQDQDGVWLEVTDDGEGIPREELPRIFERFYRGKDGRNGVGLDIVKVAVEMYGGKVEAVCDGKTHFRVWWPQNNRKLL